MEIIVIEEKRCFDDWKDFAFTAMPCLPEDTRLTKRACVLQDCAEARGDF
jgi:hypothetical protein